MRVARKSWMRTAGGHNYQAIWGDSMNFVQSSAVIKVDLQVTRHRLHWEDGLVEVWGYVGDYEVCVFLPTAEAFTCGLAKGRWPGPAKRRPKKDQP
jgi:hypothetical protein